MQRLIAAFEQPAFCSNDHGALGWDPMTDHTFDICLVAADRSLIGVVFVVDED